MRLALRRFWKSTAPCEPWIFEPELSCVDMQPRQEDAALASPVCDRPDVMKQTVRSVRLQPDCEWR
jgi:hypothetical protein